MAFPVSRQLRSHSLTNGLGCLTNRGDALEVNNRYNMDIIGSDPVTFDWSSSQGDSQIDPLIPTDQDPLDLLLDFAHTKAPLNEVQEQVLLGRTGLVGYE